MGLKDTFINYALVGLFIIAIISFGIGLANENNSSVSIADDSMINSTFNKLQSNITLFESQSQTQRDNFEKSLPEKGFGTLILLTIFSAGKQFTSMIFSVSNIIFSSAGDKIGVDSLVLGVFASILIISLIIAVWLLSKGGGD